MNKMVTLTDHIHHIILFEGPGECTELESGGLIVKMPADGGEMVWKILKKGIVIQSMQPDSQTVIQLRETGSGSAVVQTEFGELNLPLEQVKIERRSEKDRQTVTAAYAFADQTADFQFELQIEDA